MRALGALAAGLSLLPLPGCLTCGEGTHEVLDQCILDVNSVEALQAICADGPQGELTWDVEFPRDVTECEWNSDGNGKAKQGEVRGRSEQLVQVDMPEGRLPCDLIFDFEPDGYGQMIGYSDQVFITFGDAVILASNRTLAGYLPQEGNLRLWDWDALKDQEIEGEVSPWCPGMADGLGSCTAGESGEKGGMFVSFDPSILAELVWRVETNDDYSFSMITVGDNDEEDCTNSRLKMKVTGAQARVE